MNLLINERWRHKLNGLDQRHDKAHEDSFLYWIKTHYASVQGHVAAQVKAMEQLTATGLQINSINEYFGGSGIGTVILQNVFNPTHHNVWDIDPLCVSNIKVLESRFPGLVVNEGDANITMLEAKKADIEVMDFFRFSPAKLKVWHKQLGAVFDRNPKAIWITDTAMGRVPLLREVFSSYLGFNVTNRESCITGYGHYFFKTFGWVVDYAAYSNFVVMVLLPAQEFRSPVLHKLTRQDGMRALQSW